MQSLVIAFALAMAADSVEIPLKDIWALDMPGTQDVKELEPAGAGSGDPKSISFVPSLIQEIATALKYVIGKQPDEGFAVAGSGKAALQAAHDILTGKKQRPVSLPANSEVSIIVFSYQFGAYVHLDSVKRTKNAIEVRYRFVPHMTREVTQHFAIIPVGKLEPGNYGVDIIRVEDKKSLLPDAKLKEWEGKIFCKPFSFGVNDGK